MFLLLLNILRPKYSVGAWLRSKYPQSHCVLNQIAKSHFSVANLVFFALFLVVDLTCGGISWAILFFSKDK